MENEVVGTQESSVSTPEANTEAGSTPQEAANLGTEAQQNPENVEAPEVKRWKVKISGEELDLTEPELIKYAQLGKSGQAAMKKAAELEKKHRELYQQLVQAAEKDPDALAEVLTGKRRPQPQVATSKTTAQVEAEHAQDPRDQHLRMLEQELQLSKQELSEIKQRFEQQDIERERQAVEQELNDAVKKFPELESKVNRAYVKSEYARALKNGLDMSLEDVAFYVAQDIKAENTARAKATTQKLEMNSKRAPVIAPPAGGKEVKERTFDDAKRLAGLIP